LVTASSRILALSDGRAGNARQAGALADGVAAQTGATVTMSTLATRWPWRWQSPRRLPGSARAFGGAFAQTLDTPPRLAIGCGRQAALATRLLRARGTKVVQILDPRIDPSHWDLVVAPMHDALAG